MEQTIPQRFYTYLDQIKESIKPEEPPPKTSLWCHAAWYEYNYEIQEEEDHYLVARLKEKIHAYSTKWGRIDDIEVYLSLDPKVLKDGTITAAWDLWLCYQCDYDWHEYGDDSHHLNDEIREALEENENFQELKKNFRKDLCEKYKNNAIADVKDYIKYGIVEGYTFEKIKDELEYGFSIMECVYYYFKQNLKS